MTRILTIYEGYPELSKKDQLWSTKQVRFSIMSLLTGYAHFDAPLMPSVYGNNCNRRALPFQS